MKLSILEDIQVRIQQRCFLLFLLIDVVINPMERKATGRTTSADSEGGGKTGVAFSHLNYCCFIWTSELFLCVLCALTIYYLREV